MLTSFHFRGHPVINQIWILASQRRKCKYLYFVRDDAPEKEADADANDAKEADAQGYVNVLADNF